MHAVLTTSLSFEQCQHRLSIAIDLDSAWSVASQPRSVYGSISGTSFRLRRRSFTRISGRAIPWTSDPYRPFLEGEFFERESGTEIRCATHKALSINVFTSIWFIGLFSIGSIMMIVCLGAIITGDTSNIQGNPWVGVFAPPLLGILGWLRIAYANAQGEHDSTYLLDFLHRTLEAVVVTQHR